MDEAAPLHYQKEGDAHLYDIPAQIASWKLTMLTTWLVGWTLCGLVVMYEVFQPRSADIATSLLIYLAFWGYFEYKGALAWLWRRYGVERIKLDEEGIWVKRDIRSYGRVYHYYAENIREVKRLEYKPGSFAATFSRSFWVVGGHTVVLDTLNGQAALGMGLSDRDRDRLISDIRKHLKQLSRKETKA